MRYRTPILWIGLLLVIVAVGVSYILSLSDATQATPVVSSSSTPAMTEPTATPPRTPTEQPPITTPVTIGGSAPTKLYVPRLKKTVEFSTKTCPVVSVDGQAMLDPDRNDFTKSCYFVDKEYPYVLPSTNAPDLAVFAGHTSRGRPSAAFNIFYDWKKGEFTLKPGDEIWVQTKMSGSRWLVYRSTDLLTPKKYAAGSTVSLMNDPRVWGTAPTPGVLVTIGCLQPKDPDLRSQENIVIKWKFDRVEE